MTLKTISKVDQLGRVVLPIHWRRTLGIREKDHLEIFVEGDNIVVTKYIPVCIFCGFPGELLVVAGKQICEHCIDELRLRFPSHTSQGHSRTDLK